MMSEAGVVIRGFSGKMISIEGLYRGQTFPLIMTHHP